MFLDEQAKTGAWGTYIEATALAEKYHVNLVVTPVKKGMEQSPICLYRSERENAQTVHLYNSDNNHWYVDDNTRGAGNCLYNAFAQAFYQLGIIKHKQQKNSEVIDKPRQSPTSIARFSVFSEENCQETRSVQQKIHEAISKAPTPAEIRDDFIKEEERISRLSPKEQQQIADDHALALKLAREEGLAIPSYESLGYH